MNRGRRVREVGQIEEEVRAIDERAVGARVRQPGATHARRRRLDVHTVADYAVPTGQRDAPERAVLTHHARRAVIRGVLDLEAVDIAPIARVVFGVHSHCETDARWRVAQLDGQLCHVEMRRIEPEGVGDRWSGRPGRERDDDGEEQRCQHGHSMLL